MARQQAHPALEALRKLEALCADLRVGQHASHDARRSELDDLDEGTSPGSKLHDLKLHGLWTKLHGPSIGDLWACAGLLAWRPRLRTLGLCSGAFGAVVLIAVAGLWWRLSSGPIELDMATPWLSAAIKENFGSGHDVEIGGTQLERDANGRPSLRIRDIVVRDADGVVVASAPKAEVGISGRSLFSGRVRAERLSLVGAEMAVRVELDGKLTVFAGSNKHPLVTASALPTPLVTGGTPSKAAASGAAAAMQNAPAASAIGAGAPDFAALLAWVESLDASGLDGRELTEIGLKGGNLSVNDQRNGKQWTFTNIDLSVTRPKGGGIAVMLGSEGVERPWRMRAAVTPGPHGNRIIEIDTQKLSAKDLMFALRWGEGLYEPDLPLTARIRADIGPDGMPRMVEGRVVVEKGTIIDADDPLVRIPIDRAEISIDWDASRQALVMPLQIVSGGNRITVQALFDAPRESESSWTLTVSSGAIVLASSTPSAPLVLNRVALRMRFDPGKRRIEIEQGELGNADLNVALSGAMECSGDDAVLAVGVAGTRMSVAAMKELWPFFAAPKVRAWVETHVQSGTVERLEVVTNAPISTLKASGPPVPEEGLAVRILGHGVEMKPVAGLPPIRDADVDVRISGRMAVVNVGRGNVEMSQGRKLSITNGVFEVPDTFPKAPPAKARFRLDGSIPAAVELLATERLRDYSGTPLDAATSRGTLTAQVTLGLPLREDLAEGSSTYSINMDVANFSAERMVLGHKVDAALLKVSANNQGYWIRGDVKINGIPAIFDYRKTRDADPDIRVQATLDDSARSKLGFDLGGILVGPVPLKLNGRVAHEGESRFAVEADLTQAKVDNLLPGWSKGGGEAARATFTLVNKQQTTRFEDMSIEAANTSVKGMVEVDSSGDVLSANFPVFSLSNRDKATLKAERGADGVLRVTVRGDAYDGRGFIKSTMAGPANGKQPQDKDVDLDLKLGTVAGFHGETLRSLDLRISRRSGVITSFALNAKLGRDTPLVGDLRGRGTNGRQVVYMETTDAGAFFRFTDIYPKVVGGEIWVALDPQSADKAPQEGILDVRDFTVRGEAALERVAAVPAPQNAGGASPGVEFSHLRVEFTRSLGRFTIRNGLVKGPVIGATVDGYVDYMNNDVRMRGTFVPLYGLNNMFGQIPIVGLFLGGSNEGLIGLTYEVAGPPVAPILRVNPISAVAPGLLRKFFEFPGGGGAVMPQSYAEPR
jgi:hypothetical protein